MMTAKSLKIRRAKREETVMVSARVEPSLFKAFNELVGKTNLAFSELIRIAMREYAEKHGTLKADA